MNTEILNRADEAIKKTIHAGDIAGAALCVIYQGKEIYRREFGMADIERNIPMAKDSIFRCYSMTKPVTSAAVMTVVERGLISLSDPVSNYIPGFKDQKVWTKDGLVPAKREVILQDLMDMTAGVTYPDASFPAGEYMQNMIDKYYADLEQGKPTTTYDLANLIGKQPLKFHPGEGWCYSFCADVLGAVIEVATGKRYSDYLKETIFLPLGMKDTDFYVPEEKQNRFMQNYEYKPESQKLEPCTWQHLGLSYMHLKQPAFESGGAGLVSTVDDYSRFTQMIMQGGTYNGVRILGRKSIEYITQNVLTKQQADMYDWDALYGYGYGNLMRQMVDVHGSHGLGSVGEFGWDGWLGSYVAMDPEEDLTIIYVIQKCGGNGYRDVQILRNIIYSAL